MVEQIGKRRIISNIFINRQEQLNALKKIYNEQV